ncbi:MAG: SEC-C domain-containing protein, partial [Burkholderiales bacterium]|nr:SEC-C domain-containing protein [Burkholderiales bacterium]
DQLDLKDGTSQLGTIVREDKVGDAVSEYVFTPKESKDKVTYAADKVENVRRKGRPILVGTVSIEKSELLSGMLTRRGVKHEVLNAKHHQREAEIISQAGRYSAVTIATNMAGRGTDIILGGNPETMAWAQLQEKYPTRLEVPQDEWNRLVAEIESREQMKPEGQLVRSIGGLHVVGTERHEARRIDLQLRGRCGRQGDTGSSRFFLSLEDDLMRIFAGEWVKNVLTRLGMQEGEAIESRMVSRRIEGAQKKVEERNFEIRKNLLEYDEVMDEQRKRVYGFRQQLLDGVNCKYVILDMIRKLADQRLTDFLDRDYATTTYAKWAGGILGVDLEPADFRGLQAENAERLARDEASRQVETQLHDALEENLPDGEDESEWNWEALAKFADTRWNLNLRDRDLKKIGRDHVGEVLLEKINAAIEKVDLTEGAKFLNPNFGLQSIAAWMRQKFSLETNVDEIRGREFPFVRDWALKKILAAYDEKEAEYPVLAGLLHFTTRDAATGQKRYDREALIDWARTRFNVDLSVEDLRNKQHDEIETLLVAASLRSQEKAEAGAKQVQEKLAAFSGSREDLPELLRWLRVNYEVDLPFDSLVDLDREVLDRRISGAVEDKLRPEIRGMERALVLQLLDTAWKEHLLAMDHLRQSVGLRGYAQVDPKVEYRREGMRTFETMWDSIGDNVTDLVFRVEQLDEKFVGSTWIDSRATHDSPPAAASGMLPDQQAAANSGGGEDVKIEPIRNRGDAVGRNDPCPCGSGKKYKLCHGKLA